MQHDDVTLKFDEALKIIRARAMRHPAETESVSLNEAHARVCATTYASLLMLPPFTNSSVDGFAFRASASAFATPATPVSLRVVGTLYPGETPKFETPEGCAWEIMTGAPVPLDCDACVKVEDTVKTHEAQTVTLKAPLSENENLRFAGTDFQIGTEIVQAGHVLRPEHLMALAATGHSRVTVYKKTKVLLVSTGKEIVEPGESLKPGEIYNSTQTYLASALQALGCEVELGPTMADDAAVFLRFLRDTLKNPPDILMTTGAVSMGKADFVKPALREIGAQILFHKVAIRPGKPLLFAEAQAGDKTMTIVGLPGNPVSGVIGVRFFVDEFLRARENRAAEKPIQAKLTAGYKKPTDLRCFLKAQLEFENSDVTVRILDGQPSHMVRPLLVASAWAVIPEGAAQASAHQLVDVYFQRGELL